jgi:hypothetical protein
MSRSDDHGADATRTYTGRCTLLRAVSANEARGGKDQGGSFPTVPLRIVDQDTIRGGQDEDEDARSLPRLADTYSHHLLFLPLLIKPCPIPSPPSPSTRSTTTERRGQQDVS